MPRLVVYLICQPLLFLLVLAKSFYSSYNDSHWQETHYLDYSAPLPFKRRKVWRSFLSHYLCFRLWTLTFNYLRNHDMTKIHKVSEGLTLSPVTWWIRILDLWLCLVWIWLTPKYFTVTSQLHTEGLWSSSATWLAGDQEDPLPTHRSRHALDKATKVRYSDTGDWSQPVISP